MSIVTFLVIIHTIGAALGVGGATVSDFLFLKAVRDGQIDKKEFGVLKTVSSVVWTGLAISIFTGFGFFLLYRLDPSHGGSIYDPKLLVKMIVVSVIFLNGLLMHWKVFPILEGSARKSLHSKEVVKKLPLMLSTGAISITSWYTALVLGAWRGLEASFGTIFLVYLFVVLCAIVVVNVAGRSFISKLPRKK